MTAPITKEQEYLVHDYIIRTYLIDVLESDLNTISKANFKLHEPYTRLVEETLKKIRLEIKDIKTNMRKNQIKVTEPERDGIILEYKYFVRGYHAVSRYWDSALKFHATRLLDKYFMGPTYKK